MAVTFDAETHSYTVDGERVPSVTEIVAPLGADYDEPDDFTDMAIDYAAERGITMHDYIAFRLGGGDRNDYELPDEFACYADAADAFMEEHSIVPLAIEAPMPGHGFAGTPDLVCDFDGKLSVVDYKFVSQVQKTKVAAQLAGYKQLCEANGIYPESLYAVQFAKKGTYRLYPVCVESAEQYFGMCLDVYTAKNKKHPRGKID